MKQGKIFIGIIFLGIILCSCASTSTREKPTPEFALEEEEFYPRTSLAVTAKLRFSDLPVPAGFKLLQDKSFVFQAEGTRVALLKYTGYAKLPEVVEFYKEQMLLYNWELLNVVEYDKSVLNFERAQESCIVSIEPKGRKQIITISIAPRAKRSLQLPESETSPAQK